jgi:hypothetical protein
MNYFFGRLLVGAILCLGELTVANAQQPSFDCRLAHSPTEIAICSDARLSELDRIGGVAFNIGRQRAGNHDLVTNVRTLLIARIACRSNALCIFDNQIEALRDYQRWNIPVIIPDWVPQYRVELAQPADAPSKLDHSDFVVDGLALGGAVYPDSPTYKAYACQQSDQFPGFTWCKIKHPMAGKFGPFNSWMTILHSPENSAIFITQVITPAFFARGDVEREIQRLSRQFGRASRILNGDSRSDAAHPIIAVWGDVTLTPLNEETMDALRRGDAITAGLVTDFLGDVNKSARENLPVFHIGGGAGYIWGARFDTEGKGSLQISAVDTGALPNPSVATAVKKTPVSPTALPPPPIAWTTPGALPPPRDECSRISDAAQRLACYDRPARLPASQAAALPAPSQPDLRTTSSQPDSAGSAQSGRAQVDSSPNEGQGIVLVPSYEDVAPACDKFVDALNATAVYAPGTATPTDKTKYVPECIDYSRDAFDFLRSNWSSYSAANQRDCISKVAADLEKARPKGGADVEAESFANVSFLGILSEQYRLVAMCLLDRTNDKRNSALPQPFHFRDLNSVTPLQVRNATLARDTESGRLAAALTTPAELRRDMAQMAGIVEAAIAHDGGCGIYVDRDAVANFFGGAGFDFAAERANKWGVNSVDFEGANAITIVLMEQGPQSEACNTVRTKFEGWKFLRP